MLQVEVDTRDVSRMVDRLGTGIDRLVPRTAMTVASSTSRTIRADTPRRSGRLAATIGPVSVPDGAAVTYGGSLPYAHYIEGRTHAVANGVREADSRFVAACQTATQREVNGL